MSSGKPVQLRRLRLSAPAGCLAGDPEGVYKAVLSAALADGADPTEWSDRLVKAAGATRKTIGVKGELKHQFLRDAVEKQEAVYAAAMNSAVKQIAEVLQSAAAKADKG